MYSNRYKEVAIKYHVEDLDSSLIPGSRLSNILQDLESGRPISNITQEFLRSKGLLALLHYAKKDISFVEFVEAAEQEDPERRRAAKITVLKEQAEQKKKKAALSAKRLQEIEVLFAKRMLEKKALLARMKLTPERDETENRAFDNDPQNIAKANQLKLKHKYDLLHIKKADFPKLMDILHRVDNGLRLSEDEIV